jgi:hypothetical protein
MRSKAWNVQCPRRIGGIKHGQNVFDLANKVRADLAAVTVLMKPPQSAMLNRHIHGAHCTLTSVTCHSEKTKMHGAIFAGLRARNTIAAFTFGACPALSLQSRQIYFLWIADISTGQRAYGIVTTCGE